MINNSLRSILVSILLFFLCNNLLASDNCYSRNLILPMELVLKIFSMIPEDRLMEIGNLRATSSYFKFAFQAEFINERFSHELKFLFKEKTKDLGRFDVISKDTVIESIEGAVTIIGEENLYYINTIAFNLKPGGWGSYSTGHKIGSEYHPIVKLDQAEMVLNHIASVRDRFFGVKTIDLGDIMRCAWSDVARRGRDETHREQLIEDEEKINALVNEFKKIYGIDLKMETWMELGFQCK